VSPEKRKRERGRERILGGARGLLASKGIEETSMDDIAEAAGYTRRTLYSYFLSRDEVLLSVLVEDTGIRMERQAEAVEAAGKGLEKLRAWGESLYAFAVENPQAMRLSFYYDYRGIEKSRIGPGTFSRFERQNDELAVTLRSIFVAGIEDGSIRDGIDIDLSISHFIYTLRTVINRAMSGTYSFASFDPDHYVESYLDFFTSAISGGQGGQQ
jgi:AcrR family transcriptional regulator